MGSALGPSTSITLLGRLVQTPRDEAAWKEFEKRYGPRICAWCLRRNVQAADAENVTQQVLVNMLLYIHTYKPEQGGFRKWLKVVTRHALGDCLQRQARAGQGTGDSEVLGVLKSVPAREDLVKALAEEFDLELLEVAMAWVREQVEPATWEAFCLTEREGVSSAEAAARLQMTVATLYAAKYRVKRMLEAKVRELGGPDQD